MFNKINVFLILILSIPFVSIHGDNLELNIQIQSRDLIDHMTKKWSKYYLNTETSTEILFSAISSAQSDEKLTESAFSHRLRVCNALWVVGWIRDVDVLSAALLQDFEEIDHSSSKMNSVLLAERLVTLRELSPNRPSSWSQSMEDAYLLRSKEILDEVNGANGYLEYALKWAIDNRECVAVSLSYGRKEAQLTLPVSTTLDEVNDILMFAGWYTYNDSFRSIFIHNWTTLNKSSCLKHLGIMENNVIQVRLL